MFRQSKLEELPEKTAEVAAVIAEEGLRYVSDAAPGYRRKRTGTSFSYYDKDGARITNKDVVRRIKAIGIPPAYEFGMDLPLAQRPYPGDWARCAWPQAISLSSEMARTARPEQV